MKSQISIRKTLKMKWKRFQILKIPTHKNFKIGNLSTKFEKKDIFIDYENRNMPQNSNQWNLQKWQEEDLKFEC